MSQIRWVGYLLAGVVGAALLAAMVWKPAPPPTFQGLDKITIPSVVGDFQGRVVPVDAETRDALVSAQVTAREYRAPSGMLVQLTMIGGTDRSALHDPRSCLVGAGWQLTDDHVEYLEGSGVPVRVCHALTTPGAGLPNYDIEYLYVTNRHVIASATQIRLALLEAALLEQNDSPVYYVRLLTPLPQTPAAQSQEHMQLQSFAAGLWDKMGPALLKGESS